MRTVAELIDLLELLSDDRKPTNFMIGDTLTRCVYLNAGKLEGMGLPSINMHNIPAYMTHNTFQKTTNRVHHVEHYDRLIIHGKADNYKTFLVHSVRTKSGIVSPLRLPEPLTEEMYFQRSTVDDINLCGRMLTFDDIQRIMALSDSSTDGCEIRIDMFKLFFDISDEDFATIMNSLRNTSENP